MPNSQKWMDLGVFPSCTQTYFPIIRGVWLNANLALIYSQFTSPLSCTNINVVPKLNLQQIGCGLCFSQIGPSSCQEWWNNKNGIKALKHKITNKFNKHMNTAATITTQ